MTFSEAQLDMRRAYANGSTGALASGIIWLIAGGVALMSSPANAALALFIGGMFIFPLSILLSKAAGCNGSHSPQNPLGTLAMEGTFLMLACFPIAFAVLWHRAEWFFPAMLLIIGGRYLTFQTLYGMRLYWLFGCALLTGAAILIMLQAVPVVGAFAGGIIEVAFAAALFTAYKKEKAT
jgi:hypothetical protein